MDEQIGQLISLHQIELRKRDQTLHDSKAEHSNMIIQLRTQLDNERHELKDQLQNRMSDFLEGYSKMSIELEEIKKERDSLLEALRVVQDTPSKHLWLGFQRRAANLRLRLGESCFQGFRKGVYQEPTKIEFRVSS